MLINALIGFSVELEEGTNDEEECFYVSDEGVSQANEALNGDDLLFCM